MRKLVVAATLIKVRVLRLWLLVQSIKTVIKLKLPVRYSSFTLLPLMQMTDHQNFPDRGSCNPGLGATVDVIVSLYNYEKYQSVLQQSVHSCFHNPKITFHFVLVSGSDSEILWLKKLIGNSHHKFYLSKERIGIYKAWNIAIKSGSGAYITNLNADDLRLPHSICDQVAAIEKTSSDGSYGNFVLTDDIFGFIKGKFTKSLVSRLGELSEQKLYLGSQNLMHCAPVWKRELHEKLGMFDDSLQSCGDNDFWLRSLGSGAKFLEYQPVTAVYFHNPQGLSSSMSSVGHKEWTDIRDSYIKRKAMSEHSAKQ
jgi:glycosyltransferase involved in cell wall biosynthesis